jgi:hypothetical protein
MWSLMAFISAFCGLCYIASQFGGAAYETGARHAARFAQNISLAPSARAVEAMPSLCIIVAVIIGALWAWGVYALGPRWAFVALCAATCVGPMIFLVGVSVDIAMEELTLQDLSVRTVTLVSLPYLTVAGILGALLGWGCAAVDGSQDPPQKKSRRRETR